MTTVERLQSVAQQLTPGAIDNADLDGMYFAMVEAIAAVRALEIAAQDALSGWRYIRARYGDLSGVGWDRVEEALTAAACDSDEQPKAENAERLSPEGVPARAAEGGIAPPPSPPQPPSSGAHK